MDSIFGRNESAVPESMMTLIGIQGRLDWLPPGSPYGSVMIDKIIPPVRVSRHVVIAVACEPKKLRIFIEAVAAAGIGNQGKEIFISQIINPGKRRRRRCNNVFLFFRNQNIQISSLLFIPLFILPENPVK